MPSLIEVLEGMVANKFRHGLENGYLILRERGQPDFQLRAGVRQFAVRLDLPIERGGLDVALPFLRSDVAGLTCKCDLIVFVERNNMSPLVFLIEMKTLHNNDYLLQLRASREFARYLIELMKLHGLANVQPEFRGVLIKSRLIPARGTTRQTNLLFQRRIDLDVCECDRSRPLSLSDLVRAVG